MGILDEKRANHQNIDQHETSLNPAASTRSKRSGGRHFLTEGVEGSKAVFRDCRDFLKQRRDNPIHVSSKINDPRVFERLGPLPCPRLATNMRKGQQVIEKHEGIKDSEMFRHTYLGSQYSKSREKSHALDQTFILPRGYGDLRKKAPVTDHLHYTDDLCTIRQKPDESLREYAGRFSHEYSRCAEVDDKTALKAFTVSLHDCFFKYTINANTWKTYSEVMAQAYNHASAEAMTYQGKPPTTTPYQQAGSESQIQPNEKTSTF
ncbi:hypothetical protein ACFX2I_043929 [Malus domestica]